MKKNNHGFALLEMGLATVLVAGIIVILLTIWSNTHRSNNIKTRSKAYAAINNDILHQFDSEVSNCNADASTCQLNSIRNETASNYLATKMSSDAISSLKNKGINPDNIKITTCWTREGTNCA